MSNPNKNVIGGEGDPSMSQEVERIITRARKEAYKMGWYERHNMTKMEVFAKLERDLAAWKEANYVLRSEIRGLHKKLEQSNDAFTKAVLRQEKR